MSDAKYDKDHKANPGYVADEGKVATLKAKTDEIHASKGRSPAKADKPKKADKE